MPRKPRKKTPEAPPVARTLQIAKLPGTGYYVIDPETGLGVSGPHDSKSIAGREVPKGKRVVAGVKRLKRPPDWAWTTHTDTDTDTESAK